MLSRQNDCRQEIVLFYDRVIDIMPPEMRNQFVLRQLLQIPLQFCTPSGDRIELFVLPASQDLAISVKPATPVSVEEAQEYARRVLQMAVADGVFNDFIVALKVLSYLEPFIRCTADHAAVREMTHLKLRLIAGELNGGD